MRQGFFSVYRTLFALLAADEALHTDHPLDYPTFGSSHNQYAPPQGMTRTEKDAETWARDFYVVWGEFTTEKKFEWVAKWDLARADDRQMRRLMERDNKKIRDDYKKEYNEAVRVSASLKSC
jgi:DnaJ family protein A protein 5